MGSITSRTITELVGVVTKPGNCATVAYKVGWSGSTGSPYVVTGLRSGYCYMFTVTLTNSKGLVATANSGYLEVAGVVAMGKSQLPLIGQAYSLTGTFSYTAGRASFNETLVLTNNSTTFSFNAVDLQYTPRYFSVVGLSGYAWSWGTAKVDGVAETPSWTYSTNAHLPLGKAVGPGQSVVITIPFTDKVGAIVGGAYDAFDSRYNKYHGMMTMGSFYPILSIPHTTSALGDPYLTWNAQSVHLDLTLADAGYSSLHAYAVAGAGNRIIATGSHWVFDAANVRDFVFSVAPGYVSCQTTSSNAAHTIIRGFAMSATTCASFLTYGAAAFNRYNAYYGQYPYATYTIFQSGGIVGRQEYPTAISIGPISTSLKNYIYHETMHQWTYGMLGDDQLAEPWVDEAFADFSANYFTTGRMLSYCSTSVPINAPVRYFRGWSYCGQYTDVVYRKGMNFVNKLRAWMGTTTFFTAMRNYIALNRYKMVSGADLLHYLDSKTSLNLWSSTYICPWVSYC